MIVGTAGHVDHGKTALVRALTGVDTDRLQEEKRRGISIDLGFAYVKTPDGGDIGFVDVPGHERFIHTMLAGATGIDFVLLVIAADDGVMPQTREHLAIVDLLGVRRGVIALTKVDAVAHERPGEVEQGIRAAVAGTGLEAAPVMAVSSLTGEGVAALRDLLMREAAAGGRRPVERRFRLAVDRSFTLAGVGTVVTGSVLSGRVAVGEQVIVSPAGLAARVRGIRAHGQPAGEAVAGDRCALNLAGEHVAREMITRGDVVLDSTLHAPTSRIDARLAILDTEPGPLAMWMPVRFHHAAAETGARLVPLSADQPLPGTAALVQLVLERPIAAAAGDRFIIRDTSARRTIGGGVMVDLRPPTRRRRTQERLARLEALEQTDPQAAVGMLLACPPFHLDLAGFARDRALTEAEAEAVRTGLQPVMLSDGRSESVLSPETFAAFARAVTERLAAFHSDHPDRPGMEAERLRGEGMVRLPAGLHLAALQQMAKAGDVAFEGVLLRLPAHRVRLTPQDEALRARALPLLGGDARFRPPRVRDIAEATGVDEAVLRRLMKQLARSGTVREIAKDHFFLREVVSEILAIVEDLAQAGADGAFTAAQLRDRLDNGRKVTIGILEFLDRHGLTFRRGESRKVTAHRLAAFRLALAGGSGDGESGDVEPRDGEPAEDEQGNSQQGDSQRADGQRASGGEARPVSGPDFKSGKGRQPVLGGFDSHSLPPRSLPPRSAR